MDNKWYFAKDLGEEDHLSDTAVEVFRNKGDGAEAFKSIARETIQNSIDAKDEKVKAPLVVTFELIDVKKEEFPDVSGLINHIQGTVNFCEQSNKQNNALNNSKKQINLLNQDSFCILKISDFNTKGVPGSQDLSSGNSKWKALVYNEGDTVKDSSKSLGSFGMGKNAAFALSSLRTVFYVTRDLEKNYAMEGVARLYTSYTNGVKYASKGYLCNEKNEKTSPLSESEALSLSPIFKRNETGTDVLIFEPNIALIEKENLKWYLIESVISNFFMAFVEGTLEVRVCGIEINQNKLETVFKSLLKFYETSGESVTDTLQYVKQYLETLNYGEDCSDDVDYYGHIFMKLHKTDSTKGKKIAIFREHGMLIKEYTVPGASQKFSGVLVVKGEQGINFLKSIEDPNHNDFDPSRETADSTMDAAKRKSTLQKFYSWMSAKAREYTKPQSQGSISLAGMEDYVQLPEDGKELSKKSLKVSPKRISKNSKKEKERLFEKRRAREEENGTDTASIEHHPSITPPNPNPHEIDKKVQRIPDDQSDKKALIKGYASFDIFPVIQATRNICTLLFRIIPNEKLMNIKFSAVGEDGSENNVLPKVVSAVDSNSGEVLKIKNGIIVDVNCFELMKIVVTFENDIICSIKPTIYWEVEE